MKIWVVFLVVLSMILSGKSSTVKSRNSNQQQIFLVFNSRDTYGMLVYDNVLYTLQKNGIDTISWDLNKNEYLPDLRSYPLIGIVTELIDNLSRNTICDIKEYVNNGGQLIQFIRGYTEEIAEIFGIDKKVKPKPYTIHGFQLLEDFIPGGATIKVDADYLLDECYLFSFLNPIKPIAISSENVPLLWESTFGSGRTLFWNSAMLNTKAFRGFIIASITRYLEVSVRKVVGKSLIFVDDYPAPSWRAKLEPTFTELGVTDTGFYSSILLKDLEKLSIEYGIRYSTAVVFNYNQQKSSPFLFNDWDLCNVLEDGKIVNVPSTLLQYLQNHPKMFQIGFHGYNHVPLTKSYWESVFQMDQALSSAREKWFQYSKTAPAFYVPPMNEIDQDGYAILKQNFPEILSFCSVYEADTMLGQNREFDREPWDGSVIDIPRCTSGYYLNSYDRLIAFSTLEAFGIWTHFLHPDDIYSNPTNYPTLPVGWIRNPENLSWYGEATSKNGLFYRLGAEFKAMHTAFPWIEYDFVSNTRPYVENYADVQACPIVTQNQILFQNTRPQRYLVEFPLNYSLDLNDKLHILSKNIIRNRTQLFIEVDEAVTVNIIP